ncbi:unnamed protein product [Caenorhabditis bovis]|uniref:Protein kinase domain-containing protein n=1 Tax=Caenorhabditis bovis TaxID=2654633 RepID=A0A8S1EH58_9PELO|nr:unnamed protein product [Caenorhabditis bovis]
MSLINSLKLDNFADVVFARNECELITTFLEEQIEGDLSSVEIRDLTTHLIRNRLCSGDFIENRPAKKWLFLIFRLSRVLFRDKTRVAQFHTIDAHSNFVRTVQFIASRFLRNEQDWNGTIVNTLNVIQKLVDCGDTAQKFVEAGLENIVLMLLASRQMSVLQHSLEILGRLSDWSDACREHLCETNTIDVCLQLIPDGDILTQKLCVSLLRILSCEEQAREQIRIYDGVPTLLGLISLKNSRLQWHVAWTLAQLAEQVDTSLEIAQLGGIGLIFAEIANPKPPEKAVSDWIAMLTGLTALLAQLCQTSSNQQLITNSNGVFILGKLLGIRTFAKNPDTCDSWRLLQCSIFRVLRLLYTLERARNLLKKVFDTSIYELFVDIGNYIHALSSYEQVAERYETYMEEHPEFARDWEPVNERKQAMGEVGEYELLDQIGAGAFGCVYTVRKKNGDVPAKLYALKEIFMTNVSSSDRGEEKSFGDMISEVKIIKQQLRHPNIVRYRRIFVENHRLYIVMDLIQGGSLRDHIVTMKEKRSNFDESRVWRLVVQMMLALRYLHKEKQIVHRDLKPNNIMLTDNDRVVITDFGLAKQKGVEYLKSAAGTIIYSCPEIVQNVPYGEKADIWSFGCCVYEMCQLTAPFHSTNMLTLAMEIVEARYEPMSDSWGAELRDLIRSCLTPNPSDRPDILRISSLCGPKILEYLDEVARDQASMSESHKESLNNSFNSTTSLMPRRSLVTLPPIEVSKPRRNQSMSASDFNRNSLPPIETSVAVRRRVKTCSTEHPARSSSTTDLKPAVKFDGLCVRSNALRPIQDPVLMILDQIHRIVVITDRENPATGTNHQRRLVEMFRKKLLGRESTAEQMKKHLRKLAAESSDEIDMNLGFSDFRPVLLQAHLNGYQKDQKVTRITYEQLSACIQSLS